MTRRDISTPANSPALRLSPFAAGPASGFALLITITLLAFLVLLLVSLASLTRVETQVAGNSQNIAQARQNALMALNIALGQLQKYTGPDQRVTAAADIVPPPAPDTITITGPTYNFTTGDFDYTLGATTGQTALTAFDAYWKASGNPRNRHWTGAWLNKKNNPADYDSENPATFNAQPDLQSWLVSGNEIVANNYKPTDAVTGLTAASTPLDDIKDTSSRVHRLLLKTTAGVTDAPSLDRAVTAPQVTINATQVPGTSGASTPIGHYAWWVGDEGVKARANLVDAYATASSGETSDQKLVRDTTRLQSAQRPAIEAMTTNGTDGLASAYPVNGTDLLKIVSSAQLNCLSTSTTFPAELQTRYHDLSITSRGVLADVKHGGLKRDLSYILARPTLGSFRTALSTTDYPVAPSGAWNLGLSSDATPYAAMPASLTTSATMLAESASWEQLWSFYNMKEASPLGVFPAGSTIAASRSGTPTQAGLSPLLIQAKLFYSMVVTGGVVTLRITPVAVLANPYDTPLSGDFILLLNSGYSTYVTSGKLATPHPVPTSLVYDGGSPTGTVNHFKNVGASLAHGGLEKIQLTIKATNIPPGVAQIFTVDPSANLTIAGVNDAHTVAMTNTYDPSVFLTYNTGRAIASGDTHVALYCSSIDGSLYIGDTTIQNRVSSVGTKSLPASPGTPTSFGFVVYPVDNGYRRGGGVFFALQDGQTTNPQQAPFYQLNYRSLQINYIGNSSYSDHPLQWATAYGVTGDDGDSDTGPHPFLAANLLPPPSENIPATTRWGLITSGEYPSLTTVPPEVTDPNTGFINLLYQVPAPARPIISLGQLTHFNLAGYYEPSDGSGDASIRTNAYQVNYPIANSYPNPRVPRDQVFHFSSPFGNHYDGSYLWNDILWDRFTFSSFPQTGAFDFTNPANKLINARYRPYPAANQLPLSNPAQFRGTYLPAKNFLVDGAFNINSTSVEAWKALFSSLKGIPVGTESAPSAPFQRTLATAGGSANASNGVSANAWSGFRDLTTTEIQKLAEEMVLQVRLRGPFLSLAEFVNRRLTAGPTTAPGNTITPSNTPDPYLLGLSGALQSVIDKVVNLKTVVPLPYSNTTGRNATAGPVDGSGAFKGLNFADLQYRLPTRIAGYPGYLLQSDVLSTLGPTLAARSDTFTIRTYGDTINPATGAVIGRAWCEAVVQRIADYVDTTVSSSTPVAGSAAATFGRRYRVVSFRWLTSQDI